MNLESLQPIILAIAQAQSLESVLQSIVVGIASSCDTALVRVWLLEKNADCPACKGIFEKAEEAPSLHLVASSGTSRSGHTYTATTGRSHRIAVGERKIGQIIQSGQSLLVSNVTPELPWVVDAPWISAELIVSFAGQPLFCRGEILGVLAVFSRSKLSAGEFAWLRTFADHAAVAIWNARAFDELNRLRRQLEQENEYLVGEVKEALSFGSVIGQSRALQKVMQQVELVATTDATVLILGESGTGKELIARAIHDLSPRRNHPLIKVNCGAIPETLFESEFFGHTKGAFTGAIKDRAGRFELANGGDLFLDEVGEIPLSMQAKLLRVLQEKQYERVGDTHTRTADVRIIAATNRDLKKEVQEGRFREDLYYRLSIFPIEFPPLRERPDDIPPLAMHFLKTKGARMNIQPPVLSRRHMAELTNYNWPGNVRELENVIERALILSKVTGHLQFELSATPREKRQVERETKTETDVILKPDDLRQREIDNILAALHRTNGKVFGPKGAAQLLGMKPTTLASKIKALGLQKQFVTAK